MKFNEHKLKNEKKVFQEIQEQFPSPSTTNMRQIFQWHLWSV